MLHSLHDGRLVFKHTLGTFAKIVLGDDLERRLLLGSSILDKKDDAKGANSQQITHTEHISEAIKLKVRSSSIFVDEGLRQVLVLVDPNLAHQHMVAVTHVAHEHTDVTCLLVVLAVIVGA